MASPSVSPAGQPAKAPAPVPTAPSLRAFTPPSAPVDLRQLALVFRAHLMTALALAILGGSLVAWLQLRRPKLYASTASLVLHRQQSNVEGGRGDSSARVGEIAEQLTQMVTADAVKRFVTRLGPADRAQILAPYGAGAASPAAQADLLQNIIFRGVTIHRVEETGLVTVTAVSHGPEASALIANRFSEETIRFLHERDMTAAESGLVYLRQRAEELRTRVESEEKELQAIRERDNLVSLEDNQNIVVDRLKVLNAGATTARIARLAVDARLAQAQALLKNNQDLAQLAGLADFSALTDVQRKIDDLQAKRAVMAERYGRLHPAMLENGREIEALIRLRNEQIQAALANLNSQRAKALTDERQLAEQLAAAEQESLRLDRIGVEYNSKRRAAETDKNTYTQLLSRLNDAAIAAQLTGVEVVFSEHATPADAPFSPDPQKTALVTAAIFLLILFGYPYTSEALYGSVRGWHDVETHLDSVLLGEVGSVSGTSEKDRPSLVAKAQDETVVEQFRALHSQLRLVAKVDLPKTLLLTSTVPGEGKSFIASNLAATYASHGCRVLLIDADLRRPTQHKNFGVDNQAGILRWLDNGGDLAHGDLLGDARLGLLEVSPGCFLLRAGGSTRKACELMDTGRLTALLEALKQKFDLVILDTPPAGVFPDALAFSRVAQELLFICRFDKVKRHQARNVLRRLKQTGMESPGVVLNAMPSGRGTEYYYSS